MNTTRYKEPTEQKEKQRDGLLLDAISLRDYFAAKAMQAEFMGGVAQYDFGVTAERAYIMADTMLKARSK